MLATRFVSRRIHISGVEIGEELGHGAHSIVYRARQDGAPCAVKVPRTRGGWTRWIYREAVALARVRHPALPAVLEVGESDDLPYLVMELVEGETLAERLRRGPLDEAAAIDLGIELADALAAVHGAGLVHRDVKPRNILLGLGGRVRLVDFGFAAAMEGAAAADDAAGTPGYAAPEQFATPPRIDGRADLYALGRVLSECAPSRTEARGSVAMSLGQITNYLLADNPEDRYPDARALSAELVAVRSGALARGPRAYEATRHTAPLIGRDAELDRIVETWTTVGGKGGAALVVRGARGAGKTHLLAAAAARIGAAYGGGLVLEARCREGDPPLAALHRFFEAFKTANGRVSPEARAEREGALRAAAEDNLGSFASVIAPELVDVLGAGTAMVGAPPEAFAEGATEILVRLARGVGRILFMLDDFHWADPVSRDVLVRLAHRVHEAPVMLVLGTRTQTAAPGLPQARTELLDLDVLSERHIAALVASHLGGGLADPALVRRIAMLADGTPLGVLEVLGAFLDAGAVRPHSRVWRFDVDRADRVVLPLGALALLGHRLAYLLPATRQVLDAAAIVGTRFDERLLASVVGVELSDLDYALADGRRAGLLERDTRDAHRFVHDSLRETLVADLGEVNRKRLHQRVAESLTATGPSSLGDLCATALHFSAGEMAETPELAYRAARAAADGVLERFDNEMALRFLELARAAAEAGRLTLDASYYRILGEARLRVGALEASLRSLEAALEHSHDREVRAVLLGRMAWVHQARAEPELAWDVLGLAFGAAGSPMPTESASSAVHMFGHLARTELRKLGVQRAPPPSEARIIDVLSELHYQNARLGLEYGKPLRLIESAVEGLTLSRPLGASRAQARARALYGFVLTALGRRSAGSRELAQAHAMASALADPVTRTFCLQVQAMGAGWAGDFDRSLALIRECIEVNGHWLELNEYFQCAATADLVESVRGRCTEAWSYIGRAVERLRRSRQQTSPAAAFVILRARAALASLGRDATTDPWLLDQLKAATSEEGAPRGFYLRASWGARARFLVDTGDVGRAFDTLVRDFDRERQNPRTAHIMVSEYYVAVVHGRIHQCLRAPIADRTRHVAALRRAAADLRAAAKIPLLKAHRLLADGYLAWFHGTPRKALQLFSEAEAVANQESCSWVLYGIARARAHMLREQGRLDAARDQARVAEMLALAHGAEPRARWIREELELPTPKATNSGGPSLRSSRSSAPRRARRQLASLLHVVGTPHPGLRPTQQATAILDSLLRDLDAEGALLWFQPDPTTSAGVLLGRGRLGEAWSDPKGWSDGLVRHVRNTGQPWPPGSEHFGPLPDVDPSIDAKRVLAFPLFLYDDTVGAVCIQRRPDQSPFSAEDRELLDLVSHQVPVALEIARLLVERSQLQASLQQVQKMDAVGELAGGVAHDFNNMLMVVRASLETLGAHAELGAEVTEELGIISQAADRAANLTRRLLSFSRHQPASRLPVDINAAITEIEPMLRRIVADRVTVVVGLGNRVQVVQIDRGALEQALVNLTVNARDAMRDGGTLTISTADVELDDESMRRGGPKAGEYVVIDVADTGEGMTPEVVSRVFDPFFTTKPTGGGTGLGLTMVYAFAKNSGGHVVVESEVGRGTLFRLYLPRSRSMRLVNPSPPPPPLAERPVSTRTIFRDDMAILVVDDDCLVRESVRRVLQRDGYRVLMADGAAQALAVVARCASQISLVVLDVMMPGMTGPELAQRLGELGAPAKVLFISGFAPGNIPVGVGEVTSEMLLQKPFAAAELLRRVAQLVEG